MSVTVLDASKDAGEWSSFVDRLPVELRDAYFAPEYLALHTFEPSDRALLFAYQRRDDCWLYPFVLHAAPEFPGSAASKEWRDIETAYGYGGPLSNSDDEEFLRRAHAAFREWAGEQSVVAEFVRLHPLLENHRWMAPDVELIRDRETVWLDFASLGGGSKAFTGKTGNMLRRAEREGVRVEAVPAVEHVSDFVELYGRTMSRLDADSYYYFSDEYFAGLARLADESGWMLAAVVDGEWVAAAFFLRGSTWMHYHLSATDPACRLPGVTNKLIYEAAQLGGEEGLRGLHLGGGRTAESGDSLLKFKESMGSGRLPFYIGKRVVDADGYAELVASWQKEYPDLVDRYGNRLLCYRHTSAD